MGGTLEATALYRASFEPSVVLAEPYTIVTANVLAAETTEEAEWHGASGRLAALRRRTGRFAPLASPEDAVDHPDLADAPRLVTNRIVGEVSDVVARLRELASKTAANELMVTAVAFDLAARERSLELLAGRW
jgi:alkanesulfonate monooxygenase SsuD/methylene tetrahydromethanopterin reductase-like flavin-dependent oxidoreductase (luciferase family)